MASKEPPIGPDVSDKRRRPPPTIELQAHELNVAPPHDPAPPAAPEIGNPEPEPVSTAQQTARADEPADATPPTSHWDEEADASHPPPEPPRTEPTTGPPPSAASPPPPKRPLWPLLGAAAGGAALVLIALAILILAGLLRMSAVDESARAPVELSARVAALEAQVERESEQLGADPKVLAELAARIARAETTANRAENTANAPRPATPDPALTGRLGDIDIALKSLGNTTAALTSRSEEMASTLRAVNERADATAKAVTDLRGMLDRQAQSAAEKTELERLAARIGALESSTRSVEQKIETPGSTAADRDVRLAVLATALKDAVERGAPYTQELASLKPLVDDQKAIVTLEPFANGGVPSAAALSGELSVLLPTLLQAVAPQAQGGGLLDRLQANASRLVRVRPISEPAGDDPSAIIARLEVKARNADVAGALTDLMKLTPEQRAPVQAWIAKAHARGAALAAARDIAALSYSALARPAR